MQFGFVLHKGTVDAAFTLRMLPEEYHAKGRRLCIFFVDLEIAFDGVPRKVLVWAMRKKEIPDVLLMSMNESI